KRAVPLSGCWERGASVGTNPLHHGTETIRALRREMFAQTHAFEQFDGIAVQDLPCALARIDSEQDRNQSAHDMSIAVAGKSQDRAAGAIRAHSGIEPDLAGAALNLVGIDMRRLRQWRQFAPQLDQIAIAIVPVVQDPKIADDLVNVSHCVQARTP